MSTRVLIVDDSELVRRVLKQQLDRDPDIKVIGTAEDPLEASEKIESLEPDVLTLDLEMPKMDGLTFLRSLMRHHPMPVVIVSAYTTKGSRLALEALESGAVDIVPKPGMAYSIGEMSSDLAAKIKAASAARLRHHATEGHAPPINRRDHTFAPQPTDAAGQAHGVRHRMPAARVGASGAADSGAPMQVLARLQGTLPANRLIAIGSSTGGTQALQYILSRLPDNMPPILIVQHMPQGFTKTFADRLNMLSALEVKEAEHEDVLAQGRALVAPGSKHMILRRTGARYWTEITDGPKVCRQKPSVEVLFQSVAKATGKWAVGAILTGMGADGAQGMLSMKQQGAATIAENEDSCVVFGMPKEAIKLGGVDHVAHLHRIPELLHKLAQG